MLGLPPTSMRQQCVHTMRQGSLPRALLLCSRMLGWGLPCQKQR